MSSNPPSSLPSSQRPIPLRMRGDLQVTTAQFQGETHWVIKDRVSLEYFRLQPRQYHVLTRLDGRHTAEEIRADLARTFPGLKPTLADVQYLLNDFHQKRLVIGDRPGQGSVFLDRRRERRWKKFTAALKNVLYIRVPGWDPTGLLDLLSPLVRWMFHPLAVAAMLLLVLGSSVMLAVGFDQFHQRLPEFQQFFGWPNIGLLWLSMGLAKLVHELAHGLACRHFGAECHEIGVAFLVFSPCLYCDVSDSWMLPDKWQRILIASAGIAIELTISAVALFLWWNTLPGLTRHLCLNLFFVTTLSTVIYNANPLLRYDGYYILGDLLEIPNLRSKADELLRHAFARHCLGLRLPANSFMPQRRRGWFVTYAVAAALYRWLLLAAITFFLYSVLKPYGLQNLGLALGAFSAAGVVGNLGYQVYRIIREANMKQLSPPRVLATCAVLAGLLLAVCFVPLPLRHQASLLIEPRGVQHVYAAASGRLDEILVQPGQRVRQGDVLLRLDDAASREEYEKLKTARDVQRLEVSMRRFLDDPARQELAAGTLHALEEQIVQYERRLRQLVVVAPCDGIVVAPPAVAHRRSSAGASALHGWSGSPLEPENRGGWLTEGTHLLSIAPTSQSRAVLLVDQADRNNLILRQEVAVKLEHRPARVYGGTILSISQRPRSTAPKPLSNKFGSRLPTVTDAGGQEQLTSAAYEAVVELDEASDWLVPGSRGQARFAGRTRTAGQWIWRWINQTFRFRM